MRLRACRLAALIAVVCGGPALAGPDEPDAIVDTLGLSGSLRAGYWSSDRELDDRNHFAPESLWLQGSHDFGSGLNARAEGWVNQQWTPQHRTPQGELRQGYLGWHDSDWDVAVGRRLVSWGRADRVNPTDVISSRDYTLLFPDDADQKRGNLMARAAYGTGSYTISALWLPEFRPDVLPLERPPGVTIDRQGSRLDPVQFAARLDRVGEGVDWSVSYFDGVDRDPNLRITALGPSGLTVALVHRRERLGGADFATNVGGFGLRGEVAYAVPANDAADTFSRHPFVFAVIGADRDIVERLNINLQYVFHLVTEYSDPFQIADPTVRKVAVRGALLNNQLTRLQQGGTLRIAYTTADGAWMMELAAAGFATDGSAVIRPKLTYAINDNWKAIAGADVFFGGGNGFFGQLRHNRTVYTEVRLSF
jgi:hypothetical protein